MAPTIQTAMVQVNFKLPPEELEVIHACHAATYPQHQMTFGAWVRTVLLAEATAIGMEMGMIVGTREEPQK